MADPHGTPDPLGPRRLPLAVRRALAAVAILFLVVGVGLLVSAGAARFPRLVLPLVMLVVAAAFGLRALGGYGMRQRWSVGAACALAAWGLAAGLQQSQGGLVLGLALLGGCSLVVLGAAGLFQALRGTEDPALLVDGWRAVRPPHRPVLFVNPRSGDGTAARVDLVRRAQERGVRVVVLEPGDDLAGRAREAVGDGADCLGAAGGDGTLAQVAAVAAEKGVPFVCVPVGTRNHFALDLGLDRNDPVAALEAFSDGLQRRIDLGEVAGRTFLNNVSLGAYGEAVAQEQYRDHKVGTALGSLTRLVGPDAAPLPLRFTDGDGGHWDAAVMVLVSNNVYDLAPRPGFGTRASLCDGRLGVVAVAGEHVGSLLSPVHWSTPEFVVESDGPVRVGVDGEAFEVPAPVVFRVRPGALRVRIPRTAPGRSPAALRFGVLRRTGGRVGALFSSGAD
ncbi:MAG: diacylglycerol/lipid kinase family protein [Actinomycetes bacterium]